MRGNEGVPVDGNGGIVCGGAEALMVVSGDGPRPATKAVKKVGQVVLHMSMR